MRLTPPSPEDARRLRDYLAGSGYTEQGLTGVLGSVEVPLPHLRNKARLAALTADATPLHVLMRWFLIAEPVETARAGGVIPPWFIAACRECGLLREAGGRLVSDVLIAPYANFLVVSDPHARLLSPQDDHVLTVSPASRQLLDFTARRRVAAALDLGGGCGIQALGLAAHAGEVTATDLNRRATMFAQFNARLNGLGNIRCLTGDSFAPVEGRQFDLIVSNPPFILTPSHRHLHMDNPLELDQFCRLLVKQAPRHLSEGGLFQMIFEWAEVAGQSWEERLAEWFEGIGCDAWLLKMYAHTPSWYAQVRIREIPRLSHDDDAAEYAAWMAHYGEKQVRFVHAGLLLLRRRAGGRNWVAIDQLPVGAPVPGGEAVLAQLASRDFLEAHAGDAALLGARLRVAPGARLEQIRTAENGSWVIRSTRLVADGGLSRAVGLEPDVAEFLGRFDGTRTVAELIGDLAASLSAPPAGIMPECLALVRHMVERCALVEQPLD